FFDKGRRRIRDPCGALRARCFTRSLEDLSMSGGANPEELLGLARAGSGPALGKLLELYRGYLALLARLQIGRRLQGKVDATDLVQDTFLEAHRHFARFRGTVEAELVCWLRQILAGLLANVVRRYYGT